MLKILFFGPLGDMCGRELSLDMPGGDSTLDDVRDAVSARFPSAAEVLRRRSTKVCVDQAIVFDNIAVRAGQEIAFLPPLSGG